jgi:protein phosphatase PTC7
MLAMGAANIPHDDKLLDGGDDAYFITNSVINAVGIADGVGSWRAKGINAGLCAVELMKKCKNILMEGATSPFLVLEEAENSLSEDGSTTVLLAHEDYEGLKIAQVGDSNLVIIRNNYIFFQTTPQQHIHDQPYQVGKDGKESSTDARLYTVPVHKNDIIILGSDGLWDNLYPSQAAQIISPMDITKPSAMAQVLAMNAYNRSHDETLWSPFTQRAYEEGIITPKDFPDSLGGKTDDITVVVAVVQ